MARERKAAYLNFDGAPFYFDCVLNEKMSHTATATEHPVEEGVNVSDHIRPNLAVVNLSVFISNTPVRDVNELYNGQVAGLELKVPKFERTLVPMPGALMNAGIDAIASAINGPEDWKALVLQFPEPFEQATFIFNTLIDWQERGVVGKVITADRTYEKMYITSIQAARKSDTGDALEIDVELKQIRIVEAKLITAPVPTETRGKVMKSKGRQPTSFVRDPAPKKSVFKKLSERRRRRG